MASAICIGYFWGARLSEYTCTRYTSLLGDKLLQLKHLKFVKKHNGQIKSLCITIAKSKVNQFNEKTEIVEALCTCRKGVCGPCIIASMLKSREKAGTLKPDDAVLVNPINNKPLAPHQMNNLLQTLSAKLGLNSNHYRSHSLKIGRATDLARAGVEAWIIAKWGRWSTNSWQQIYARLDCTDLAQLTHTPLILTHPPLGQRLHDSYAPNRP